MEFIESNPELHELYEESLKELFGLNNDERQEIQNRSHSLFVRFLSAALFNNLGIQKRYDFRMELTYIMTYQGIKAMSSAIMSTGDNDELRLFGNNVANTELWSRLLASRYDNKIVKPSRHRIDYTLPK